MKPMLELKSSKEESVLLSNYDFDKKLSLSSVAYMIVVDEENDDTNEPPPIMLKTLKEFKDVIPNEIPCSLLPMRKSNTKLILFLEQFYQTNLRIG